MATWEEEKRAAQTAFTLTGNLFQDVHSSVGNVYQQILMTGRIYTIGHDSLTHQITEDMFRQPEHDMGFGYEHSFAPGRDDGPEPER